MSSPNWQRYRTKSRKTQVGIGRGAITALIIFLAVMGVLAGCTIISPTPPGQSAHAKHYISLSGQNFIYNNTLIHPYGSTMYPHWIYNGALHRGGGWTNTAFKRYIDQIISMAQQAHLNTIRPTNYFDGITYGDWYNATVWSNMDYLFQQAARHNMYVILDLSSFRDKTLKQGIYPYDPSLYTAAFSWVASRYANNPALLNYAIAGEVKCPTSSDPLRPTSTQALTNYYRVLSNTLYAADPNHLISSGGLLHLNEPGCGIDWRSIFSLPHINMAAIHVYSDDDRKIAMPMIARWAASNLKPFTVEEFGFKQGNSDTTRASEFQNMYNLGKQYNATTMIFWNLGPEIASSSYEVNPNTPFTWNTIIQNAPR
jgi:endo-1,4-beta-mannosidase